MIRPSSLQLKELFFPQVSVKALVPKNPGDTPSELPLQELDLSFGFDVSKDGKSATAGLKVESKDGITSTSLYTIALEAIANFSLVNAEHVDEKALYLRRCAAAAALVGAIREQVSLMTSRGPWGVAMLPMISMDAIVGPPPKVQVQTNPPVAAPRKAQAKRVTAK